MQGRLAYLILLVATSATPANARVHDLEFCHSAVPISVSVRLGPNKVNHVRFISNTRGSVSDFVFRNSAEKALIEMLVLVEYFDSDSQRMLGILHHAATLEAADKPIGPIRSEPLSHLFRPITPGGSYSLGGYSPIITTRCPIEARITLGFFRYQDETTHISSSQGWQSDLMVDDAPQYFDMQHYPFLPHSDILLIAEINREGRIARLVPEEREFVPMLGWLLSQLSEWEFVPAMREGSPIDSQIDLLLRFDTTHKTYHTDWFSARGNRTPLTLAIVSIEPHKPEQRKWIAFYGARPASRFSPDQ